MLKNFYNHQKYKINKYKKPKNKQTNKNIDKNS